MHGVKPTNLGAFITNFNNTVANILTPAGKAVAASGLIIQAQLIQLGTAIRPSPSFLRPTASSIPPIARSTRRSRIP